MNAEAQRFLSTSGETLTASINSFSADMNTLINKTIEDTMINAKQYEAVRWVESTSCFLFARQLAEKKGTNCKSWERINNFMCTNYKL